MIGIVVLFAFILLMGLHFASMIERRGVGYAVLVYVIAFSFLGWVYYKLFA